MKVEPHEKKKLYYYACSCKELNFTTKTPAFSVVGQK